jgi:hypothetical protein
MFRELAGLPAHALIVHGAVVFIPLACLFAVLYALWPAARRHVWWAVIALGVVAPLVGWAARLSGDAYKAYWESHGASGDFLARITQHQAFGNMTAIWTTPLGVAMLWMVIYAIPYAGTSGSAAPAARSAFVRLATQVVVVVLAAVSLYYVIRTGDSGARLTHPHL